MIRKNIDCRRVETQSLPKFPQIVESWMRIMDIQGDLWPLFPGPIFFTPPHEIILRGGVGVIFQPHIIIWLNYPNLPLILCF